MMQCNRLAAQELQGVYDADSVGVTRRGSGRRSETLGGGGGGLTGTKSV